MDERFYWVSRKKEKKMLYIIKRIKKYLKINNNIEENNINNKMMTESVEKSGGIFKYLSGSQTSQEKDKFI